MITAAMVRSRIELETAPPPRRPEPAPPQREPAPEARGDGLFDAFRRQPFAEKVLGGAALAVAFGWLVSAQWSSLLQFGTLGGWFSTFSLVGTMGVLSLMTMRLLGIGWLSRAASTRLLIGAAMLPALGIAVELLNNFWFAVTLVGAVAMAWSAGRISLRDGLFRRGR